MSDLTDRLRGFAVAPIGGHGAFIEDALNHIQEAADHIDRLEAALAKAEAYNHEEGDPADTLHHGNAILAFFRERQ